MTTNTETDERFERYTKQHLPLYLRDARPPDYTGSEDAWVADRAAAVGVLRRRWADMLALGFTPAELVGDKPMPEVYVMSGRPVRLPEPDVSAEVSAQASALLREATARNMQLDYIEAEKLRYLASGRGNPRTAEGIIASVRGQIQRHDAVQRKERIVEDHRPTLTVRRAFRAKGNRSYAVGQHRIDGQEVADLLAWVEENEAQARIHGWPAPAGFEPEMWPPFQLSDAPAVKTDKLWGSPNS